MDYIALIKLDIVKKDTHPRKKKRIKRKCSERHDVRGIRTRREAEKSTNMYVVSTDCAIILLIYK